MKSSMQLISTLILLVLLFSTSGMEMVQGQQMCKTKSLNYRGYCFRWRTCKHVCISEGFPEGKCEGFIRQCFCRKPCFRPPNQS
ncbi:unnamed protein product [Cochlearia groenlandica]